MPKVLTAAAVVLCPHGGKVQIIPSQTATAIAGNPVLVVGDLDGKPIVGCAQPVSQSTAPCTATLPMTVGASTAVVAGGVPVLLETATGMTNGVPSGSWQVQSPGQAVVDAGR
ncbi:MAG: hypothetical protein JXA67_10540 [Micromonosporaceae bacterium]|nr:hypothetical protein [Micromonosporaceae bacterium]